MPKMRNGWISLSLVLGLVVGGLPAQASEVVKLARLVVSGKRSTTNETARPPATEPRSAAGTTSPASGGGDDTGTAPAPPRGIS